MEANNLSWTRPATRKEYAMNVFLRTSSPVILIFMGLYGKFSHLVSNSLIVFGVIVAVSLILSVITKKIPFNKIYCSINKNNELLNFRCGSLPTNHFLFDTKINIPLSHIISKKNNNDSIEITFYLKNKNQQAMISLPKNIYDQLGIA